MAFVQLENDCKMKRRGIPEREMNSAREGGWPSCFATAAMDRKMCFLSGMGWGPACACPRKVSEDA